jgi:hypothetical protein
MKQALIMKLVVSGIVFLFMTGSSFFVSAQLVEPPVCMNNAQTLYVGGSGPGNFTKIQDAVDNASDGDTVFVYDGLGTLL